MLATDDDDEQFIAIPPEKRNQSHILRSVSSTSSIHATHNPSALIESHVKSEPNTPTACENSRETSQWALRGALMSKNNPMLTTLDEVEAFFKEAFINNRILPDVVRQFEKSNLIFC